jgi:tRNA-dependent cyclodipeptide synthase
MDERTKHKVKRIYPGLVSEQEKAKGIKELSKSEVNKRLLRLYAKKSFIAVSLSSNEFSENASNMELWRAGMILGWIDETFGKTDFLISDSLYRYYNQILYGYDEAEALAKGLRDGNRFLENCVGKINELGLKISNFNFLKWSDIITEFDFIILHEKFKRLIEGNSFLKDGVKGSANTFIERNIARIKIPLDLAVSLANEVIIEELAVFAYMGELGYQAHIYPSTFMQVLMDINTMTFEDIPHELSNQTLVQIKIVTK